jgi:C4-dicarboxylate-specific signal transduction histidine kinase
MGMIALSLGELRNSRAIVRTDLADDLPSITADRVQLRQVILNLLRNPSDAMNTVDDRPRDLALKQRVAG